MFINPFLSNSIKIFAGFVIWRSILIISAMGYIYLFGYRYAFSAVSYSVGSLFGIFYPWANFDGVHYLTTATYGYSKLQYAFFPAYPGIINAFGRMWPDPLTISLLISNLSTILLLFLLYKLIKLDYDDSTAKKTIWLFLAYPAAFFLGAAYNESLFLCFVVSSFIFAKKQNFWLAGVFIIAASLTRLVGVFLIPSILLIWWSGKRKKIDILAVLLGGVGFLSVMVFNYLGTGDPLSFIHSQPLFGANRSGGELILLPQVIYRYIKIFITGSLFSFNYFIALQEFILVILSFVVIWVGRKKIALPYIIYSLGVLLTPTLTGTLSSMPRYILAAFPVFIIVSQIVETKWKYILLLTLLFLLELLNAAIFTSGYFVS